MAEQRLRSVVVKKYNHHADHGSIPDDKVNILKRDLEPETITPKWCTDITYIHLKEEGWAYLDSAEAHRIIFEYIEGWYNRKRMRSPAA